MISEKEIAFVTKGSQVQFRLASNPYPIYTGNIVGVSPKSANDLVSPILSNQAGGLIALKETQQAQTVENYFKVWIETSDLPYVPHLEERVYILINHPAEPIIFRVYRFVRQNFLARFNL
jgi:hypothetical protein